MSNIKISDLTPDDKNYNKGSEFGNSLIEKSLRKFGAGRSILLDKNNKIIAGNKTIENAGAIGLDDIIVVETTGNQIVAVKRMDIDLDSKQGRELALADNASAKASINWDFETIKVDWQEIEMQEWGIEIPDFEVLEAEEDDFAAPDGGIETDIVLGDLFEIGEHRLLCGDSTDSDQVAKLMNGQKADMVFTDPPYGMHLDTDYSKLPNSNRMGKAKNYDNVKGDNDDFTNELINTIFACFNDCKEIFIWGADYFAELLPNKNDGSWIVWDKRVEEKFDKMIGSAFELCWSKSKHQRKIARFNNTLFSGEQDAKNKVHPTQKPIKLASWFLEQWSEKDNLIADLYLGSGTTMVAAHQLKRICYGMELDPKYCQVILNRMKKLDPSLVIKKNGVTL